MLTTVLDLVPAVRTGASVTVWVVGVVYLVLVGASLAGVVPEGPATTLVGVVSLATALLLTTVVLDWLA
jgi:hypothetical protein